MDERKSSVGLHHAGLCCRTAENADRFYGGVLGLENRGTKSVPAALARALFGLDRDLTVRIFSNERLYLEIFILEGPGPAAAPPPAHLCVETDDLARFLERCRSYGVPVVRAPKGDAWLTFIRDDDGNLFEVKEAKFVPA